MAVQMASLTVAGTVETGERGLGAGTSMPREGADSVLKAIPCASKTPGCDGMLSFGDAYSAAQRS